MSTVVLGGTELDAAAAKLVREAARFQRRVVRVVSTTVRRAYFPTLIGSIGAFMPSGYAPALAGDLRAVPTTRFTGLAPGVEVRVSAPTGGPRGRAVDMLERGVLRAPSWPRGRRDTWRWHGQRVRRGFASTPLDAVRPLIIREIDQELAAIKRDVEGP